MSHFSGFLSALWGLTGVGLLLGSAAWRLWGMTSQALSMPLTWLHWISLGLILAFMAYAEGYRGFQQAFSPRVVARARYLKNHPTALRGLLAPLFCMAFFDAPRKRKTASWCLTAGIVVLVVLVRLLPQPWRGLVDAGVVLGLMWGLVSLVFFAWKAFFTTRFDYPHQVVSSAGAREVE